MPLLADDVTGGAMAGPPVRFPLPALIARYTAARVTRRTMSRRSAHDVEYSLRRFAATCPPDIRQITYRHVQAWIDQPQFADSTRRRILSELRQFFRWAVTERHIRRDPTLEVETVRQPPAVPGSLTRDEAAVLHAALRGLPHRERLMISLELNEALRRVELARMQVADIDRRGGSIRVRGKAAGGRGEITGVVPLSPETAMYLDAYLGSEPGVLGIDRLASGPLFRNRQRPHDGLSAGRIGWLVADTLKQIGVKRGPGDGRSGHALRHTAATEALEAGVPIEKVQRVLRHKHSKTTDHYTAGAVMDLREFHEKRQGHWDDVIDLRSEP